MSRNLLTVALLGLLSASALCAPPARLDDVQTLNDKAGAALAEGRPAEAVLLLESALRQRPADEVLVANLAWAYFQRGKSRLSAFDDEGALVDYAKAAETNPAEPGFALHHATLALQLFRLGEALSVLETALAEHAEHGQLHLLHGDVLALRDELDPAVEAYGLAVRHGADDVLSAARSALARAQRQAAVERDYASHASDTFLIRHPAGTNHLDLVPVLDRARVEVCQALDAWPSDRALVVLYPPEAFREVTGTHEWVGGLFDRKIRLPIHDASAEAEQIEAAFRHEFAHLLVSERNPRCPTFLNEGLAQWVELGRGEGLDRLVKHLKSVGMGAEELPLLKELPGSFVEVSDHAEVALNYLVSYAFVDHLVAQQGSGAPLRWVWQLRRAPLDAAYQAATGRSLALDEEQFRQTVRVALGD